MPGYTVMTDNKDAKTAASKSGKLPPKNKERLPRKEKKAQQKKNG
jgi:hypothetical protein